jgi:malate permease and related proteins
MYPYEAMETTLNDSVTFLRILSIVFPVFGIVLVGCVYGRRRGIEMAGSNQINMDIFIPALVFSALADQSFELAGHQDLALGAFLIIVGSGLVGWMIANISGISSKVLVPTMMFNNCGNLGLPLAVLAFGREGLTAAVVMFLVSNLVQFSFGIWFLDHQTRWYNVWRTPVIIAAMAGLSVSFSGLALWQPLQLAIKMLGDVSIPLSLFALGIRIAHSHVNDVRVGLIGAIARPATGILIAWLLAMLLDLKGQQSAMLIIFGALPPAVINYVFAERYQQGPDEVAAIVLIGNIAAVLVVPLILAGVL